MKTEIPPYFPADKTGPKSPDIHQGFACVSRSFPSSIDMNECRKIKGTRPAARVPLPAAGGVTPCVDPHPCVPKKSFPRPE